MPTVLNTILYLNEEVLHLVLRPVGGVVVALVGDVVLASRPCWLHVTREGGLHSLSLSSAGLISSLSVFRLHNIDTQAGRREPSPTFKDFYSERLVSTMIYSRLQDIQNSVNKLLRQELYIQR